MTSLEYLATFPELTSISEATKTAYIDIAASCIDTNQFCVDAAFVIALQAAHMMAMVCGKMAATGAAGAVTAIREDTLSLSFSDVNSSNFSKSSYNQTRFGQLLLQFMRHAGAGIQMSVI